MISAYGALYRVAVITSEGEHLLSVPRTRYEIDRMIRRGYVVRIEPLTHIERLCTELVMSLE